MKRRMSTHGEDDRRKTFGSRVLALFLVIGMIVAACGDGDTTETTADGGDDGGTDTTADGGDDGGTDTTAMDDGGEGEEVELLVWVTRPYYRMAAL